MSVYNYMSFSYVHVGSPVYFNASKCILTAGLLMALKLRRARRFVGWHVTTDGTDD